MRPRRPQLISLAQYQAPPKPQIGALPKSSRHATLASSCRALQSILGNALPSPRLLKTPKKELRNPFEAEFTKINHRVTKPTALPRGQNKRRRDECDIDEDKENVPHTPNNDSDTRDAPSTPKRTRRLPLEMPLGLSADDFRSLSPVQNVSLPPARAAFDMGSRRCSYLSDVDSGYGPSPRESEEVDSKDLQKEQRQHPRPGSSWTIDDDRVLVETVLEKLQLSKRAWNDCARRLGKDKDSLGRRWNMLVGDGGVGLKRGGRLRRADLDVGSW